MDKRTNYSINIHPKNKKHLIEIMKKKKYRSLGFTLVKETLETNNYPFHDGKDYSTV